jgi:hypothetical protein
VAQVVGAAQVQADQVATLGGLPGRTQVAVAEDLAGRFGEQQRARLAVEVSAEHVIDGDQPVEVTDTISHGEVVSFRFESGCSRP